jgi:hypothetical protein
VLPNYLTRFPIRLTHFPHQANAEYRAAVKIPHHSRLRKFSAGLNVTRAANRLAKEIGGGRGTGKTYIADMDHTMDALVKLFTDCFGDSKAAVKRASKFSKLAGANMVSQNVAHIAMLASRERLKTYVKETIEKGSE